MMNCNLVPADLIVDGVASRYIKPSCYKKNDPFQGADEIDVSAFDLRDRQPPELFVSFHLTAGVNDEARLVDAHAIISKKISNIRNGAIALLDVAECLEEVNDEPLELIAFRERNHPHCGLFYLSENLVKIQEAKTTMCYLARRRMSRVSEIAPNYVPSAQVAVDMSLPMVALADDSQLK